MRTSGAAIEDFAATVIPPIVCNHPDDVAEVHVVGDYRVMVRFNDGTSGTVDLTRRVRANNAGVFSALSDPEVFASVHVFLGAVTWSNGVDLAPDAMYEALRASGEWILD